ncbi:CCA tRNA nucleotidyltransferase 1, mitochondrial isoform X2 [Cephus cinctus]|nr:CCA tRNA nucleotidyltransferase 1, mitochondrial isoform X2 [Cephus cinctus]XP_015585255.1 CCA tRNA nucleotidyltransferase 1, mitochondrial isoform X2 [Cephus cinctus]
MSDEPVPRCRSDPLIMKLDTPEFHSIFTPELNTLSDIFKKYNYEIRVAGGAVRDILMGMTPKDLDFATTATPDQMTEMFSKEEVRMINANGAKHGTITPRINNTVNFEVTTLRIDVVTDGRHAEVKFTTDWLRDANRRDLTINSMFLDLEGNVYDYFYGYDDLLKRKVVFVGHASTRIQEDYLRILRYFRFYGRIANDPDNHDEETITAIKNNVSGLERISGERIWSEWQKILDGKYNAELMCNMIECGMAEYIGLPKNPDVETFKTVCHRARANTLQVRPITLICAMLRDQEEVMALHSRLKLAAYDRDLGLFIVQHREDKPCEKPLKPYQYLILNPKGKIPDSRGFVTELLKYKGAIDLLKELGKWQVPRFPLNGNMLKPHISQGKLIGPVMGALKKIWLDDDFKTSPENLIKHIPEILDDIKEKGKQVH